MKKSSWSILILAVIVIFVLADLFVNVPGGILHTLPTLPSKKAVQPAAIVDPPNVTQKALEKGELIKKYTIEKRTRSTELFEKFDLTKVVGISAYKNLVISHETPPQLPVYVYEIHGAQGQGAITYLNLKLAMINQLGSSAGINETGGYGFNSLFYNDEKNPSNGFLLSQVGDIVFGFKYSKDAKQAFDFVTSLVNNAVSLVNK